MRNTVINNFVLVSFIAILVTRLIPHPPNFTSTLALAFYLPVLFGVKFIIIVIGAFILSDLVIGMHQLIFFTWASLLLVGYLSKFFKKTYLRPLGISISCILFFIISNFGVWLFSDLYTLNANGLITCYTMAIPFLQNSLIGTIIFALVIELILTFNRTKIFINKVNATY
mgnify:CR=1 FL=1